jgi:hypothetical protein
VQSQIIGAQRVSRVSRYMSSFSPSIVDRDIRCNFLLKKSSRFQARFAPALVTAGLRRSTAFTEKSELFFLVAKLSYRSLKRLL